MFDEKKYPLTYKEFEDKIISLYLEKLNDDEMELFIPVLEEELSKKPNFVQTIYGQTCFDYDNPQIYGEIVKKSFDDDFLRRNAVPQLENYLG